MNQAWTLNFTRAGWRTLATVPYLLSIAGIAAAIWPATAHAGAFVCPGYQNKTFCADLSGDCKVTASDALAGLRMAVGQIGQSVAGDMDHSGAVTASDALKILPIAVASLPPSLSCGSQYALDAVASGFYTQSGVHGANNYAVGWYTGSSSEELRDYFVFDLSSVPPTITSGFLYLTTVPNGQTVYPSKDASETYTLSSVTTSIATVKGGTGGVSAFNDLGAGTILGNVIVDKTLGATVDVPLTPAGLTTLNAVPGEVAFGGAITTLTKGATGEYLFNSTNATMTRKLIVIAP